MNPGPAAVEDQCPTRCERRPFMTSSLWQGPRAGKETIGSSPLSPAFPAQDAKGAILDRATLLCFTPHVPRFLAPAAIAANAQRSNLRMGKSEARAGHTCGGQPFAEKLGSRSALPRQAWASWPCPPRQGHVVVPVYSNGHSGDLVPVSGLVPGGFSWRVGNPYRTCILPGAIREQVGLVVPVDSFCGTRNSLTWNDQAMGLTTEYS